MIVLLVGGSGESEQCVERGNRARSQVEFGRGL